MCNVEHVTISKNNAGVWRSGHVCRSVIVLTAIAQRLNPYRGHLEETEISWFILIAYS